MASVNLHIHNLREQETFHHAASQLESWTSISSEHSAKKSEVTSYTAYVTSENCFQTLANLKELNSLVEETVRNMGMIGSRYQDCTRVQDICNETFNILAITTSSSSSHEVAQTRYNGVKKYNTRTACKQKAVKDKISEHKIVILGDSHARNITVKLHGKLHNNYEVTGYAKLNVNIETVATSKHKDADSLSRDDGWS